MLGSCSFSLIQEVRATHIDSVFYYYLNESLTQKISVSNQNGSKYNRFCNLHQTQNLPWA